MKNDKRLSHKNLRLAEYSYHSISFPLCCDSISKVMFRSFRPVCHYRVARFHIYLFRSFGRPDTLYYTHFIHRVNKWDDKSIARNSHFSVWMCLSRQLYVRICECVRVCVGIDLSFSIGMVYMPSIFEILQSSTNTHRMAVRNVNDKVSYNSMANTYMYDVHIWYEVRQGSFAQDEKDDDGCNEENEKWQQRWE